MFFSIFSYLLANCYYLILYVSSTNSFPKPLSAEEEYQHFLKMRSGSKESKNILIEHNLRLVAHIIKKYHSTYKDQEDLLSIGTMGLIKAINTFNIDKGVRFSTYGARCVENEILMHFRNSKKLNSEVFLSDPIDSDSDGNCLSLIDVLSCDDNIDDILDLKIRVKKLYEFITSVLTKREKCIIELRYGITNTKPLTQREVAGVLNISRSYVSRIEKKALEKLKSEFEKNIR